MSNFKICHATKKPRPNVRIICPRPTRRDEVPISLITFGFKWRPTIKSRNAIPSFEKTFITSVVAPNLIKKGLMITPAIMYPIIIGCLNDFAMNETINAVKRIIANWINICSISFFLLFVLRKKGIKRFLKHF